MSQQCFPQPVVITHNAYVDCLLCSPPHHTSSPIDAESFCKSALKLCVCVREREHFMGNMLGRSYSEATEAKFHSPEIWVFPDKTLIQFKLGKNLERRAVSKMMDIWNV